MSTPGDGVAGAADRTGAPATQRDVISIREERLRLAGALLAAAGFRVVCPEGRVGRLTAVKPGRGPAPPERIEVDTGLFIPKLIEVPVADVIAVDPVRHRVQIRGVPERQRRSRAEIARRVRRFLRAGGR